MNTMDYLTEEEQAEREKRRKRRRGGSQPTGTNTNVSGKDTKVTKKETKVVKPDDSELDLSDVANKAKKAFWLWKSLKGDSKSIWAVIFTLGASLGWSIPPDFKLEDVFTFPTVNVLEKRVDNIDRRLIHIESAINGTVSEPPVVDTQQPSAHGIHNPVKRPRPLPKR